MVCVGLGLWCCGLFLSLKWLRTHNWFIVVGSWALLLKAFWDPKTYLKLSLPFFITAFLPSLRDTSISPSFVTQIFLEECMFPENLKQPRWFMGLWENRPPKHFSSSNLQIRKRSKTKIIETVNVVYSETLWWKNQVKPAQFKQLSHCSLCFWCSIEVWEKGDERESHRNGWYLGEPKEWLLSLCYKQAGEPQGGEMISGRGFQEQVQFSC